jgi:NAD(P)-dependent dehydrogenase (short-subunit alcohol dehydrogenase family)
MEGRSIMNRIALITGAGKGIGEAIALALAREGVRVALAARTLSDLERVAQNARELGSDALPVQCDVTHPAQIAAAIAHIRATLGPITILINNAGMAASHKFLNHDDALWQRVLEVNLNSVYYVTKAVLPMMIEAQWGRIINVASIAAKVGGRYMAAYTASKHAVLGLTRALALELVPHHITVNALCPGYVDTPMTDQTVALMVGRNNLTEADARALLAKTSPQNRLITPEEVAHLARLLIADDARGITGQALNIDGGTVMT